MALKEKPQDSQIYELLGEAYLRSGQLESAKKTYQTIQCYLTEETRSSLIKELESLANQKLANKENVLTIIHFLKSTPLHQNHQG